MSELDQKDQPAVSRNLHKNRGEIRGDVSIRGLWNRGTDCIVDVLEAHEKEKIRNTSGLASSNVALLLRSWSPLMA
jgi:hypothetical protein